MAHEYMFVGLLMVGALLLALAALGLAWVVRPHKGHGAKTATYEFGIEVIGGAWVQFRVGYYIYALLFVLLDVEAALLLPWAVAYRTLPLYTLLEATLFLLILLAGAAKAVGSGSSSLSRTWPLWVASCLPIRPMRSTPMYSYKSGGCWVDLAASRPQDTTSIQRTERSFYGLCGTWHGVWPGPSTSTGLTEP